MKPVVAALLLLTMAGFAPPASQPGITTDWDLDRVYPTSSAWAVERAAIERGLAGLERLKRHDPQSSRELVRLLDAVLDLRGRAAKMAKVGTLQALVATDSEDARRRQEEGAAIELRVERHVSFLDPLLRRAGEARLMSWLEKDRDLGRHRRRILRTIRLAKFAPPPGLEAVPTQNARWSQSMSDAYSAVMVSNLSWPSIALGGASEQLDPGNFGRIMRLARPADRGRVAETYLRHLATYQDLFAVLLVRRIEADLQAAKLRGLDDSVDQWLAMTDAVKPGAYRSMFAGVRAGREELRKAAAALRRLQGSDARYSSIYANAPVTRSRFPLSEAEQLLLQAVSLLGRPYQQLLRQRLGQHWLHLEPSANKSSTVGVFWQAGGGHPHGLLKYRDDFASARTLGGTAVLMMGYASVPAQMTPDRREEDLPIYSNTLWYLGFQLMDQALLKAPGLPETDRQEIRAVQLTSLLRTYVRSAVLAELESHIGERIARGEAVTGEDISRLYKQLLEEVFGSAGFAVDDYMAHEWMSFPTLFSGPHYATFALSSAAAVQLEDRLRAGDRQVIDAVTQGIGRSETHFSNDILADTGIDIASPQTYSPANQRIGAISEAILRAP